MVVEVAAVAAAAAAGVVAAEAAAAAVMVVVGVGVAAAVVAVVVAVAAVVPRCGQWGAPLVPRARAAKSEDSAADIGAAISVLIVRHHPDVVCSTIATFPNCRALRPFDEAVLIIPVRARGSK